MGEKGILVWLLHFKREPYPAQAGQEVTLALKLGDHRVLTDDHRLVRGGASTSEGMSRASRNHFDGRLGMS